MSESEPNPLFPSEPELSELHLHELTRPEPGPHETQALDSTTEFIRRAVSDQVEADTTKLVLPKEGGLLPAKTLLAIVSYCYTKGIYSCRDIELAMLSNPALRESLGSDLPSDTCLRSFRRLNRAAIQAILESAFARAKNGHERIHPNAEANAICYPPAEGSTPSGGTRLFARQATEDQMQKALFVDGMTKDA